MHLLQLLVAPLPFPSSVVTIPPLHRRPGHRCRPRQGIRSHRCRRRRPRPPCALLLLLLVAESLVADSCVAEVGWEGYRYSVCFIFII